MFNNVYQGKKVLITGHTGFKGTWLSIWLNSLGANIIGVSKDTPTQPSMFEILKVEETVQHNIIDTRDFKALYKVISSEKPDFIFHLASQAIVSESYESPLDTISSNVMGASNLLESLRILNHKCTAIIITSDKAYDNLEQIWGYKENDSIGGKDIYSGSKGAVELIFKSYYHSFFKLPESNVRLSTVRAGNVIGGGDWAKDRLVVDLVLALSQGKQVKIRSPNSTRPWQHVLEPLSGYLHLGQALYTNKKLNGEGFNFGPPADQDHPVKKVLEDLSFYWGLKNKSHIYKVVEDSYFHESGLLRLNCEKSFSVLKWEATLNYQETIKLTSEWYYDYYNSSNNMLELTSQQISHYQNIANSKSQQWTE